MDEQRVRGEGSRTEYEKVGGSVRSVVSHREGEREPGLLTRDQEAPASFLTGDVCGCYLQGVVCK